jgi:hypothetical protein
MLMVRPWRSVGSVVDEELLVVAVNNFSVCTLYLKRLSEAVQALEQLVREDPPRLMHDSVVYNLCTMYDLQGASHSKRVLQIVADRFHLDDLGWQSFRLNG